MYRIAVWLGTDYLREVNAMKYKIGVSIRRSIGDEDAIEQRLSSDREEIQKRWGTCGTLILILGPAKPTL